MYDAFLQQKACAYVLGIILSNIFVYIVPTKWDDDTCSRNYRCIYQDQGNATNIFLDRDGSLLLDQSGRIILPLYTLYSDGIEALLVVALIFFYFRTY